MVMGSQAKSTNEAAMKRLRCVNPKLENEKFVNDSCDTSTSFDQVVVEELIQECFNQVKNTGVLDPSLPLLIRERHTCYLKKGLISVPKSFECLDCSRPWLCYWILHALRLLDSTVSEDQKSSIINFLLLCQHPEGGFGGGPGQLAHLAPTYAAVNSLCILQSVKAYEAINREKLLKFLLRMKKPDGSFSMNEDGETDIRGIYCALSVASLTNIIVPELIEGAAEWITRCQTYEGGFGGVPSMEAHGGYTFCGFASLVLMRKENQCNIPSLLRWLVNRQMRYEGGFQGRTNKLVDSCYSFWQGGTFPLIHRLLCVTDCSTMRTGSWLFDQEALQEYLLICCQYISGGLIDKPEKPRDYYHTCYALSGLSVAQHFAGGHIGKTTIVGSPQNELNPTHPIYNIAVENAVKAIQYFRNLEVPKVSLSSETNVKDSPEAAGTS